eukprot:TRINITY_DN4055_c0_g1_i2.p1 TRINITY_DN4055_c0_g1~~TRINITY_DN4055_c0_g1_i2.p1  ORF type:complete len:397 (-),score=48.23 TRINITY_DN4055_c0_g1_i2:820-2010(-)
MEIEICEKKDRDVGVKRLRNSWSFPTNQRKSKVTKQQGLQDSDFRGQQAIEQWRKLSNLTPEFLNKIYETAFGCYAEELPLCDFCLQQDSEMLERCSNHSFQIEFGSSQTQNVRKSMEDRYICVRNVQRGQDDKDRCVVAYAGVFDGHNGAHAADICVQAIFEVLVSHPFFRTYDGCGEFISRCQVEYISCILKEAFSCVDEKVLDLSVKNEWQSGSTGLVAFFLGKQMFIASCGDSRAVLSNCGTAVRLSVDHKPSLQHERERILRNGGKIISGKRQHRVVVKTQSGFPCGLAISRALGDLDFKEPQRVVECEPDVHHRSIQDEDNFVIMASDGLWDVVSDQQAVDIVKDVLQDQFLFMDLKDRLDLAASRCQNAALKYGSTDNITVVVIFFERR